MTAFRVNLIPSSTGIFHVRAKDGLSLCGRKLESDTDKRSGDVCGLCLKAAKAQGYQLPPAFIGGHASGTKKAAQALQSAVKAAVS